MFDTSTGMSVLTTVVVCCYDQVSAVSREGFDDLLDTLMLQAEILELRADDKVMTTGDDDCDVPYLTIYVEPEVDARISCTRNKGHCEVLDVLRNSLTTRVFFYRVPCEEASKTGESQRDQWSRFCHFRLCPSRERMGVCFQPCDSALYCQDPLRSMIDSF